MFHSNNSEVLQTATAGRQITEYVWKLKREDSIFKLGLILVKVWKYI